MGAHWSAPQLSWLKHGRKPSILTKIASNYCLFGLHVEKRTKRHVFSLWRDVAASRHQAKPGLASGCGQEAPFRFDGVCGDTKLSYGDTKILLVGVEEKKRRGEKTAPDMKRFFRNSFPSWNFLCGKLRNRA